ncbi:hypothetical protein M5K25_016501 [Dendrobium thyrsiflorum]|uniref:Uncharacterized protein n=1 Tax=Dendrobium thyrsiflorum TaxID=117978 RepID=A0ABD0UJW0_DENTH
MGRPIGVSTNKRDSAMAFSGPSVTFCFGSDSRVTLPESLLSSLPAGGITFGSFTDSAYVTFGGPTPSEAAAFSPPQRRGRAAMRPFGRPVARQPARAAARPAVVRAQPVRPVARQPVPRPLPVQPVRPVVRRPAPTVPVVRPAPAPQRRQPVVPLAVVPVEVTRARVSPLPSSSRKRGAQAELPSPSSHRVSVFARLSHPETVRQTPVTPVVAPVPPVQSVGLDVASSSTSGLGRRARRNRNRRLRLAASEAAVQEMVVSVAQQEPVQRRVVPSQRKPRRPTVVHTPDVVVAPEIDAVQGGRFSPLVHSGDEEDAGRIAAAPPVTTTLPRARVPRDGVARALTQRIRSIVRSARGRGRVSEERLLREISQVHFQLQRQSVRQSYQWRRGQPPRQSTRPVATARPLTDAPSVGRRPRRHGRRPPSEPVRSQLGSVVVVPPPQSDAPSTSRRSRWVWRRRQVDQPVETEQTVGTVRRVDTVVPSVAAAIPMICDRAADDVEFVPSVSPSVRVESAGVSDQHGASSPMGPHIDALCQTFSEDDWLGEESEEDVPVHRVCVVTRRGTSDEHRDVDDDMEEQGEADVPSTSAQGGPPRSVDTDATDKGKRPMVSSAPQRPPPPPRPQFPPRPQLPPQAPAQSSGQFQPRPPVQQFRPPLRSPEKQQFLQEKLSKEYPFKRESSEQCGSQHSSQSSDSGEPLSSGEEWQLALSRKTRGMIRQAVQSSEAVERRPPQAKSTVASTFTLPVSSSPSSVVVPTEHISSSSCIRKMYEREKLVVTSEGKTGSLPALTLKDFVLPPIDDELMEEGDSGYFWSFCVPSSSRSRTRSFHVLSISDDDVVSLHEEEFECDEPVFTIPEGGCYMDSGDESEGTPQPLLVEATQAMTLEPNESPDEFDSVQEIQLRSGKGPRQPPAQGPIRPLVQGPSQVCIEADVSAANHARSPFQFAVGHDVPPSRGRGWRGRGRSRDSDCPARNLYSRVPPPNFHHFPLTVESDSDDEMIDIIHHPTPSQSLSFADYNAFPTVRRHLIPEGGLVIDGGSDDDVDVGRQDTNRQSFPHPRYGMRVEGSSQQPSSVPPSTSVRGPLHSDSPSVHELHTLYVPPQPGWHASLFHSVGVPQSTDTPGFVESTVDDEITFAPRLSSPFLTLYQFHLSPPSVVWDTKTISPNFLKGDTGSITNLCQLGVGPHSRYGVLPLCVLGRSLFAVFELGQANIELFSFIVFEFGQVNIELFPFAVFEVGQANVEFPLFWLGARQGLWEAYFTTSSFPLFTFLLGGCRALFTLCFAVFEFGQANIESSHSPFSNLVRCVSGRSLFVVFEFGQANIELFSFIVFEFGQANIELFSFIVFEFGQVNDELPFSLLFVSPFSKLVRQASSPLHLTVFEFGQRAETHSPLPRSTSLPRLAVALRSRGPADWINLRLQLAQAKLPPLLLLAFADTKSRALFAASRSRVTPVRNTQSQPTPTPSGSELEIEDSFPICKRSDPEAFYLPPSYKLRCGGKQRHWNVSPLIHT